MLLFPLLLACLSEQYHPAPPAPFPHTGPQAPGAATLVDASAGWFDDIQARIRAEAHAIHAYNGVFVADLPLLGLVAHLDADGVTFAGEEGETLSVRTTAWGRHGALVPVDARKPALGDCTAALDVSGDCVRRLEYADVGMTEWWIGLGTGLKQGWTVEAAPAGEGPLVLEIAVDGALFVDGGGEEASILDAEGREWSVRGVTAFDADGEPVRAGVVASETGLRVEVDDTDAVYPLEIDPIYTTAAWTADGFGLEYFGMSVSAAGDVNGDGYDDVIVGAPGYLSETGRAYVFHGSSTGLGSTPSATMTGGRANDQFGASVACAGDVNGDGYDDVVVGAFGYIGDTGRVNVYLGSSSGVGTTPSATMIGESSDSYFGSSVAGAGDVNWDGYDDVVVGAPGYYWDTGRVYVYHGSPSGPSTTASVTMTGDVVTEMLFGRFLGGVGDVNGDGYDDVGISAEAYDPSDGDDYSHAYIFHGTPGGLETTAMTTLTGGSAYVSSVAGVGDVNGDGYDDVGVAIGRFPDYSYIHTFHGTPSGLGTTASATVTGSTDSVVAGAGDVNGDGYDDVVVGDYVYLSYSGRAYLFHGTSSGLDTTAITTLTGESSYDRFGRSVSGVGDVNGDGYDDVVIGAMTYWTSGSSVGRAYLYLGHSEYDVDGDGVAAAVDCDDADASIGVAAILVYPDSDGDGYGGALASIFCDLPDGYVTTSTDCDDGNAAIHPGAAEFCNGADDDCDGAVDPDTAVDAPTWYADIDADGYTDPGVSLTSCAMPDGYAAATDDDCDDGNAAIHPGAAEFCNGADDDCDGAVDPGTALDAATWYADADADGYTDPGVSLTSCAVPDGYAAATDDDCDDGNATIHPGAAEFCNGADDDCDGAVDPGTALDAATWYADADADGYTDPGVSRTSCAVPDGYAAATDDDCDDGDAAIHPGASEVPNDGIDQDCDGADAQNPSEASDEGCGCQSASNGSFVGPLALGLVLAVRRRRTRVARA